MYKATIVPRGGALGMVNVLHAYSCTTCTCTSTPLYIFHKSCAVQMFYLSPTTCMLQVSLLPEKDELSWTKKQLLAQIDVALGGRVAEELIFGADNITTGMCTYTFAGVQIHVTWYCHTCDNTCDLHVLSSKGLV